MSHWPSVVLSLLAWLRIGFLLGVAGVAPNASSQLAASSTDDAPRAIAMASGPRPVISLTALGDPMNRVGDPVFVVLTLRNIADQPLLMKAVAVGIDPSASARLEGGGSCELIQFGEITLAPGEVFQRTCRFPVPLTEAGTPPAQQSPAEAGAAQREEGWQTAGGLGRLRSADVRLAVDVSLSGRDQPLRLYTTVPVAASDISLFVGGMAGALLLAIFVWLERLLRQPETRQRWRRDLGLMALLGFRGGLLAAIVLSLSKTTQGAGMPVTIVVADFSGGLLVGLFSYPLANWIWSTLKPEWSATPPPAPGATSTSPGAAAPAAPPSAPPASP